MGAKLFLILPLVPLVALAIDSMGIVNTLLSSLTSQAQGAIDRATSAGGAGGGSVDLEELNQEIEALKEAQKSRSAEVTAERPTDAPARAAPQFGETLAQDLKENLRQMESVRSALESLVGSLKPMINSTAHNPPMMDASASDNSQGSGGNSFVIKVAMPGSTKTNPPATPADVGTTDADSNDEKHKQGVDKVPISLKIYDPIDASDESTLAIIKQRLANDLKENSLARSSRAQASSLSISIDEEIRMTALRLAQARDHQEFYEDLCSTYHADLVANDKEELALSIEANAQASINSFMNA